MLKTNHKCNLKKQSQNVIQQYPLHIQGTLLRINISLTCKLHTLPVGYEPTTSPFTLLLQVEVPFELDLICYPSCNTFKIILTSAFHLNICRPF